MTHTEKEKEADIGGMWPEVKECWQPPTSVIRDCPGRPEVDCLPSNAGDMGSVSGQGTRIPHT